MIEFGMIAGADASGATEGSWDGEMLLPREVVAAMMEAAKAYVDAEIEKLGVQAA
jgi:hypothetical protein